MSWMLLLGACLLTCLGQIAQKYAVLHWQGRALGVWAKLKSPWLLLAFGSMGAGLLLWILLLQRMPVGLAYPMLSLNFVFVTLAAHWLFHETVDARHWAGVAFIVVGVALLGMQA